MPIGLDGIQVFTYASVGGIELDAVINERHQFDADISENPVESGAIFSDNIVLQPVVLEMNCRVSDASMSLLDIRFAGHSVDIYKSLVALQKTGQPFEVVTGINVYTNMMIASLGIPRESSDGESLRIGLVLRELLVVGDDSETNRERIASDIQHSAIPAGSNGLVQTVPV